jgi:multidrug efflux pump subunit AcrA (membrane-fusion protein)
MRAFLLIAAVVLAGCSKEPAPAPVQAVESKPESSIIEIPAANAESIVTEEVRPGRLSNTVRVTGKITYNTNQTGVCKSCW